jgi:integrase
MISEPKINEKIVAALPTPVTGNKLHYFSGAVLQGKKAPSGFAVRVTAAGSKSFVRFYRKDGKPYVETLGRWDENLKGGDLTVLRAITAANEHAKAIREGRDPRPERTRRLEDGDRPQGETVADLLDEFIARYATKEAKLRSAEEYRRTFDRLVKPAIGRLGVYDVRRSDINKMLDGIADNNGLVMCDHVLAYIRKAFNWRAARDDDFHPPIAKGMARTKPKERERQRTLTDDEIRAVWKATESDKAENSHPYSAFIRFLLLTGARLREASNLTWAEIDGDDWILPASRQGKTKKELIRPLSAKALALLKTRSRIKGCPWVFTTDGKHPISGFTKFHQRLFNASGTNGWTPHDLRRTARSLMSRAGVATDHAERCLGHLILGVRRVYDRHDYYSEKKEAYEKLDDLVGRILKPKENVAELARRRRAGG